MPQFRYGGRRAQAVALLTLVALFLGLAPAAHAGGVTTRISGTVTGSDGAKVTDAILDLSPTDGAQLAGVSRIAQTDDSGSYAFTNVPAGTYAVCVRNNSNYAGVCSSDIVVDADGVPVEADLIVPRNGSISGRVTDSQGRPIAGISVSPYGGPLYYVVMTDDDGRYTLSAVPDVALGVAFADDSHQLFVPRRWTSGGGAADGDTITLSPGETRTGVDVTMSKYASMSGFVTDAHGTPLNRISVSGLSRDADGAWTRWWSTTTDSAGHFEMTGLVPGEEYRVWFRPPDDTYQAVWWNGGLDAASATSIVLAEGELRRVDMRLEMNAFVGGTVHGFVPRTITSGLLDLASVNDQGFTVTLYRYTDEGWRVQARVTVSQLGGFGMRVPPGDYRLKISSAGDFATQWWPNSATAAGAKVISLGWGSDVRIASSLYAQPGQITGTVTSSAGTPAADVDVTITSLDDHSLSRTTYTDALGNFSATAPAGRYRVQFTPGSVATNDAAQFYPGVAGPSAATVVTVSEGRVVNGVDATLAPGGTIAGSATPSTDTGQGGNWATVLDGAGGVVAHGQIWSDGTYTVSHVPAGDYTLRFGPEDEAQGSTVPESMPVHVDAGATTVIDAALSGGNTLSGSLVDHQGAALSGCKVRATPAGSSGGPRASVTDGGAFSIRGLAVGAYRLTVTADSDSCALAEPGYFASSADGHLTPIASAGETVQITSGAGITLGELTTNSLRAPVLQLAPPAVRGSPVVGNMLVAASGRWSPANVTLSYQWLANGRAIPGATRSTFNPTVAQAGMRVNVQVHATAAGFRTGTTTSPSTASILRKQVAGRSPRVTGRPRIGRTVRVVFARPDSAAVTYDWVVSDRAGAHPHVVGHGQSLRINRTWRRERLRLQVLASRSGYAPLRYDIVVSPSIS